MTTCARSSLAVRSEIFSVRRRGIDVPWYRFRRVRGDAVTAARGRRRPFYRAALAAPPRPGGHHRHSRLAAGRATAAIIDSKTPKCARARSTTLFDLHRHVRPRGHRSARREARHDALDARRAIAGAIPGDRSAKQRALCGHGPDHHVGWIRSRTRYDAAPCSARSRSEDCESGRAGSRYPGAS